MRHKKEFRKEYNSSNPKQTSPRPEGGSVLFVLPAILLIILVAIVPLLYSLVTSFTNWIFAMPGSSSQFVGFSNYIGLLKEKEFWYSVRVTFVFASSAVLIELILGTIFAVGLDQKFIGRGVMRSLIIIPFIIPPVVIGMFWKLLYMEEFGILNYFLVSMGLNKVSWLGTNNALLSSVIVDVWQATPFVTLIALAGLQLVDNSVIEAARVDGATGMKIFFYIELPSLVPYLMIASLFRLTDAMKEFDKIFVLTMGGPGSVTTTLSIFIYDQGFRLFKIAKTAACSWIFAALIFIIIFPVVLIMYKGIKKGIY